ncbi:hypothetical protein GTA08_BOTSDO11860 [Botryosphaeria dothidea]|uniref:DUF7888 domain-containing protein n=1 Tax=Botryosphaeria dothidea TaxID=55169 RepID=A0A8H4J3P5_9PEZI|nr:hypothetical protein GTA08_BOTSDO14070 [Botryosphaeria dothidea]KAF4312495.1 hypothetical protein GTA08_BOTSDO11860 [Botryosphaeria dothidea]
MVRLSSALAFLAMGTSILANPIAAKPGNFEGSPDLVTRADIGDKSSAVGAIGDVVNKVVKLVQGMIDKDIERRQAFTQKVAREVADKFPGQSVIVCNVGYSLTGSGDQLVYSTSYNAKVGSDVTFDVIVFKSPKTFDRQGDGGYENWAFYVDSSCTENGGHVECL